MNQCRCSRCAAFVQQRTPESCSNDKNEPVMAFVPFQQNTQMYNECLALERGTLFSALDKPFKGKGGCCGG